MKHVVHLMRWFLPETASFIRNQILYHERYQPAVVYLQARPGRFQKEIAEHCSTHLPITGPIERFLYAKTRQLTPSVKSQIKRYLLARNPDLLHVHYGVDALVYADLLRDLARPACVSFYGYDCTSFPKRFGGYGKRLLQRRVFHNPAIRAVLAMTEDMQADLIRIGCPEDKIIVHYYGTETKPFYQPTERSCDTGINFLILSGLHEKKGHVYLLRALQKAQRACTIPLHLHIVGDGPERQAIEATIARSGLANVTMHGSIPYGSPIHHEHLGRAHIFVHPSVTSAGGDKEGIPGALIEAMAAGLPVISTYHAGIPHVVTDQRTGLLVGERDVESLAEAMVRLATDPAFRKKLAVAGQAHALEQLDIQAKERELESIYDQLATSPIQSKQGKVTYSASFRP